MTNEQIKQYIETNKEIVDSCLLLAKQLSKMGICTRANYGAVLWKPDCTSTRGRLISTGYTTVPKGEVACNNTISQCLRSRLGIPSGERYEICKSIHAEWDVIMNSAPNDRLGTILFLAGSDNVKLATPCSICERMLKYSHVLAVVRYNYNDPDKPIDIMYLQ